jgi:hypothetical protein
MVLSGSNILPTRKRHAAHPESCELASQLPHDAAHIFLPSIHMHERPLQSSPSLAQSLPRLKLALALLLASDARSTRVVQGRVRVAQLLAQRGRLCPPHRPHESLCLPHHVVCHALVAPHFRGRRLHVANRRSQPLVPPLRRGDEPIQLGRLLPKLVQSLGTPELPRSSIGCGPRPPNREFCVGVASSRLRPFLPASRRARGVLRAHHMKSHPARESVAGLRCAAGRRSLDARRHSGRRREAYGGLRQHARARGAAGEPGGAVGAEGKVEGGSHAVGGDVCAQNRRKWLKTAVNGSKPLYSAVIRC